MSQKAPLTGENMLESAGYEIVPGVVSPETVAKLKDAVAVAVVGPDSAVRGRGASSYAMRDLLRLIPIVRQLANGPDLRAWVDPVFGTAAKPVRGLLFDKTPQANWKVPWHQDLSIAVRQKLPALGYGPWSVKAGIPHVQPPREVLESMLTVRLHLDDCTVENGPLQVLPGSHSSGILDQANIESLRGTVPSVVCPVPTGGVLLMRPLLLHASSPAILPHHRRVIHIEYAAAQLSGDLEWYEA
jgi:ectoine hydroxylase-related dioxygenase (phytanoyl-CoA dioxygenase family)